MESLKNPNKKDDENMNQAIKNEQLKIEVQNKNIEYMHLEVNRSLGFSV